MANVGDIKGKLRVIVYSQLDPLSSTSSNNLKIKHWMIILNTLTLGYATLTQGYQ